ncbi:MAG: glycosyltransferase [Rhodocyclaceae bacterium]
MSTAAPAAAPVIAVVVPTYRRPDLLARCLTALMAQTVPAGEYEIIVADDGPDDETEAVVASLAHAAGAPRMHYLRVTATQGPAGARNRGWHSSAAGWIAFTDDDTIPDADWLRQGMAALALGAAAAVGSTVVPMSATPTDHERDIAELRAGEFTTANCFLTRQALLEAGGFDERYTQPWREGADLHFALMEKGLTIMRAPGALVTHPVRPAPWGVSVRLQRKVMYDVLLYRKYPRQYRQRIHTAPPVNYYAIVIALAAALIGLMSDQMGIALAGLIVWLVLTATFCQQRLQGTSHSWAHVADMALTSMVIPPLALFWRAVGGLRYRVLFF